MTGTEPTLQDNERIDPCDSTGQNAPQTGMTPNEPSSSAHTSQTNQPSGHTPSTTQASANVATPSARSLTNAIPKTDLQSGLPYKRCCDLERELICVYGDGFAEGYEMDTDMGRHGAAAIREFVRSVRAREDDC